MLQLSKLQIGYETPINKTALSKQFELGNLVVLLGRNGCGKTTFLRTLGRFLNPIEGEVLLDNKNIRSLTAKDLANLLSIVTTERIQTPYMKVYDLIALGRYPYLGFLGKLEAKDEEVIQQILEDLNIEHLADKYISACSDGEQQMVLLARALAQDTAVILLDEATAHLDFVNRIKIFQTLHKLAKAQQKLIFLATHELEIALKYADLAILFQKDIIEINTPSSFVKEGTIQQVFKMEGLDYKLNL